MPLSELFRFFFGFKKNIKFTISKAIMPVRSKGYCEFKVNKKQQLERTEVPIINTKLEINLYSCAL